LFSYEALAANGRWGLRNLFLFSKALASKNVWHLVQGSGLLVQFIKEKYLALYSVEEWIRNPVKKLQNASIVWKAVILAFLLVGNWLM
jgi:hypothetical protein